MRDQIKNFVKNIRIMQPLVVLIFMILGTYAFLFYSSIESELKEIRTLHQNQAQALYQQQILEARKDAELIVSQIQRQPEFIRALKEENTQKLKNLNTNLYKDLDSIKGFKYLSFANSQRQMFLRMHDPESTDVISVGEDYRPAVQSKQAVMKIDGLGVNGIYTLRLIYPCYVQDQLIGFIELGKEISGIAAEVADYLGVSVMMLVPKKVFVKELISNQISRQKKDMNLLKISIQKNWNAFKNDVVIFSNIEDKHVQNILRAYKESDSLIIDGFEYYKMNLKNEQVSNLGTLIFAFDVRSKVYRLWAYVYFVILSTILFIIYTGYHLYKASNLIRERQDKISSLRRLATIGEASASIAHEVKTPLAVISGTIDLLKETFPEQLKDHKNIFAINRSVSRIRDIIESYRKLARLDDQIEIEAFEVKNLVTELNDIIGVNFRNLNLKFSIQNKSFGGLVEAPENQVLQILLNLINNAKDAILDQPGEAWIHLEVTDDKEMFSFSVINSGPKMPKKVEEKLFTQFFTTKQSNQGTGLGLSISRDLAEKYHGALYYDSKYENTKFVLKIPRKKSQSLRSA